MVIFGSDDLHFFVQVATRHFASRSGLLAAVVFLCFFCMCADFLRSCEEQIAHDDALCWFAIKSADAEITPQVYFAIAGHCGVCEIVFALELHVHYCHLNMTL